MVRSSTKGDTKKMAPRRLAMSDYSPRNVIPPIPTPTEHLWRYLLANRPLRTSLQKGLPTRKVDMDRSRCDRCSRTESLATDITDKMETAVDEGLWRCLSELQGYDMILDRAVARFKNRNDLEEEVEEELKEEMEEDSDEESMDSEMEDEDEFNSLVQEIQEERNMTCKEKQELLKMAADMRAPPDLPPPACPDSTDKKKPRVQKKKGKREGKARKRPLQDVRKRRRVAAARAAACAAASTTPADAELSMPTLPPPDPTPRPPVPLEQQVPFEQALDVSSPPAH